MELKVEIRAAKPEDLPRLIELCHAHAIYENAHYEQENKAERLAHFLFDGTDDLQCLVVESKNELIAYATFMKQFSTWDAAFYLYLDCLYLQKKARGFGLGKRLMTCIKDYALQENCIHIQWQTPNDNLNAIQFYRHLGASSKTKERFFWEL